MSQVVGGWGGGRVATPPELPLNVTGYEKGEFRTVSEILFSITHNYKAVIATVLKLGVVILQSLLYTH